MEETLNAISEKIPICINRRLALKIKLLVQFQYEWAGWGVGEIRGKKLFIEDILIPPQEASGGEVELGTESDKWLLQNHSDKIKRIVCHIHSHNSMSAFFSGSGSGAASGDRLNHQKLIKGRKLLAFLVVAQSKEKLFDYECEVGYKNTTPLGTTVFGEIPATLEISEEPIQENKALEKLKAKLAVINKESNRLSEEIDKIENAELNEIKKETDKILSEQVKIKTYPIKDYATIWGEKEKIGTGWGEKNLGWAIQREGLTERMVDRIEVFLESRKDLKHLTVDVDREEAYGRDFCNIFINCGKKKIMEKVDVYVDKILWEEENKLAKKPVDYEFMTERDLNKWKRTTTDYDQNWRWD